MGRVIEPAKHDQLPSHLNISSNTKGDWRLSMISG